MCLSWCISSISRPFVCCLKSTQVYFLRCDLWCGWSICSSFVYLREELFVYLEEELPTFAGCRLRSHVGYQGSTGRSWHPNLWSGLHVDLSFDLPFFICSIFWIYQSKGLFIICAPDTDVIEKNYVTCSWTHTHTHREIKWINIWILTLLNSTNLLFLYFSQ